MYPGYGYYGVNPLVGIISFVFNILFWILLFWAFFALIKSISYSHHYRGYHRGMKETDDEKDEEAEEENSNLDVIKRRYAEGEITKKEYDEMKKELS